MAEVVVWSEQNLRQQVWAGEHSLGVDEPPEVGGDDTGPDPYELLLAALGSCTNITLLLYARRKGWPLERVETRLTHQRIHAQDCQECEQEYPYHHRIGLIATVGYRVTDRMNVGFDVFWMPFNTTFISTCLSCASLANTRGVPAAVSQSSRTSCLRASASRSRVI